MRIVSTGARALGWLTQAIGDVLDWVALDQRLGRLSIPFRACRSPIVETKPRPTSMTNERLA